MSDTVPPRAVLIGRLLRALVVLFLLADAATALLAPDKLAGEMAATGFPPGLVMPLGLLILACALVYAIPQTAVLGAILISGFVGGAICTHFRIGEIGSPPQLICVVLGLLAWSGLYLGDARVRALLPLRR